MKIVITIQTASDGGVFITFDPPVGTLIDQVDAGTSTAAHVYALVAYKAIHDRARDEQDAGSYMETGEIPSATH